MERILDGASGDSEQRHDSIENPENTGLPTVESAARNNHDVSFSPDLNSPWKSELTGTTNDSSELHSNSETASDAVTLNAEHSKTDRPSVPAIPPVTQESESRPVMLREIRASEPSSPRDGAMPEDEYWATEYGLHFPLTEAGGGDGGGTQPPKDTASAKTEDPRPGPPTSAWTEVKSLARDVAFAAITAILIVVFVVQPVKVEGTSMLPQLENGERIFVNKFIYSFDSIHRGDIVVFWYPDNPSQSFIKRVIGLPGDTIKVVNGHVFINDKPYNEPYLSRDRTQQLYNFGPEKVKQYHYFVMGDNRDASNDSRAWGEVPEKYIYGKAMFRYWPLSSFGSIPAQADDNQ